MAFTEQGVAMQAASPKRNRLNKQDKLNNPNELNEHNKRKEPYKLNELNRRKESAIWVG
jgi:hypothetical protein